MNTGAVQGMDKISDISSTLADERCKWCQQAKQAWEPSSKERRNREKLDVLSIVSS
jgi:hypothetical protein